MMIPTLTIPDIIRFRIQTSMMFVNSYKIHIYIPNKLVSGTDQIFARFDKSEVDLNLVYYQERVALRFGMLEVIKYYYNDKSDIPDNIYKKREATEAILSYLLYPMTLEEDTLHFNHSRFNSTGYLKLYNTENSNNYNKNVHKIILSTFREFLKDCSELASEIGGGYDKIGYALGEAYNYYDYIIDYL